MTYKARQGDIIWLDLDPRSGHEQKGRRPVLVVSNNTFNDFAKTGAMICPITSTNRNSPFQPTLDNRTKTSGVIMCDQARILDMQKRSADFIECAPADIVHESVDLISGLIEVEGQ